MWVGTRGGLFQFVNGRFARYTAERDRASAATSSRRWSATDDTLWIGTDGGGVSRLRHGSSRRRFPPSSSRRRACAWSKWAATIRCGRHRGRRASLSRGRTAGDPHRRRASNNSVQILHVDDKGALWVGTNGGGITSSTARRSATSRRRKGSRATSSPRSIRKTTARCGGHLRRRADPDSQRPAVPRQLAPRPLRRCDFDLIEDDRTPQHLWMNSARGIFAILVARCAPRAKDARRVTGRLHNASEGGQFVEGSSGQQPQPARRRRPVAVCHAARLRHRSGRGRAAAAGRQAGHRRGTGGRRRGGRRRRLTPALERRRAWVTWTAPTFRTTPIRFRYRLEGFDTDWIDAARRGRRLHEPAARASTSST